MAQSRNRSAEGPTMPWWRYPIVWMVIGGPAVVVVAAIVTAVIAIRGADVVITQESETSFSERPAVQGRNHAATPSEKR